MVKLLLAKGADADCLSIYTYRPIHMAAVKEHKAVVDLLISRGAKVDIFVAAALGLADKVKDLLAADPALVKVQNGDNGTAMHWAARTGKQDIVELLLAAGSDINAQDRSGATPLQYAVSYKQDQMAEFLRKKGAR